MRPDTHDLSFLIDHLIQEEGVGDRKQGPEGGGQIPGGKGTGEKAEYCIAAVPYFRPFFSGSRAFVLFLLQKFHAMNLQFFFPLLSKFTHLFCVSVTCWLTA